MDIIHLKKVGRGALATVYGWNGTLYNARVRKGSPLKYVYSIGLLCHSAEVVVDRWNKPGNFVHIVIVLNKTLQLQFKME